MPVVTTPRGCRRNPRHLQRNGTDASRRHQSRGLTLLVTQVLSEIRFRVFIRFMAKATGNRFCCSQGEWHKRFDLPFCNPCGRSDDGNCRNNRAVEVEDRRRDAPDVGNEFFPFDAVAGFVGSRQAGT